MGCMLSVTHDILETLLKARLVQPCSERSNYMFLHTLFGESVKNAEETVPTCY